MKDPKLITSYAQYNEDIILLALLHDVKEGFYIDVGANYPIIDSVTKLFYEKGWHGINIEPVKSLYEQIVEDRPRDINLNCGAGSKNDKITFREFIDIPGHSTFELKKIDAHNKKLKYKDYEVEIKPLKQIFNENRVSKINFLKIDVEGFEKQVIEGNDWEKYRPEVICIEANHAEGGWQSTFAKLNYKLFISDGLNEYYVANQSWRRTQGFAERVVKLDYNKLRQHQFSTWQDHLSNIRNLKNDIVGKEKFINALKSELDRFQYLANLSLREQPLRVRVKRAIYGLTVDWLRYKKSNRKPKS
jgi:FkbM family methyltransferase